MKKAIRFHFNTVVRLNMKLRSHFFICTAKVTAISVLLLLPQNQIKAQSGLEAEIAELMQHAVPAVVTILANVPVSEAKQNEKPYTLVGTGLCLNEYGFIVTRSSIVEDALGVRVRLWNGENTHADVIGIDGEKGIALLKIDSPNLPTLPYAGVNSTNEGAWVLVIGNSLGVSPALSVGNVTSIYKDGWVEISANIDPGANGAPVLDADGKVIGIVSGRIAYSRNTVGVMPSGNTVLVVPVEHIYKSSYAICERYQKDHGWIGITVHSGSYSPVTPQITKVIAASPAEKASLQVGDVILSCDGQPFESYYSLRTIVKNKKPGDHMTLEILRGLENIQFNLRVGQQQLAELFKSVPIDGEYEYTENSHWNLDREWSLKNRNALETRLKRMENEIKNLRKKLNFKKN